MGALYGYLNFNKKPEPDISDQMRSASAYWGRDNHFFYSSEHVFIGNNHRFNTPEAVYEQQPYTPIPNNYVFFTGRIDNRKDLTLKLNIKDELTISDGFFVSKAWEKYKTNIVDHLEGDWVVVVWEANEKRLHILRDHHGISAMYYYKGVDFFAFGTSIKSLLTLQEIHKKPDMLRVVQVLTSWQGNGTNCGYEGIYRLPPAHTLKANKNGDVVINRFWFPENIPMLHYSNKEDYYNHFFEEYSRAVKVRLRSYTSTGCSLSSGLDSSSIAVLANLHLDKEGKSITAFTSVPAFDVTGMTFKNWYGNEEELVKLTIEKNKNINWIKIDAKEVNPIEEIIKGVDIQDEPVFAASNIFWINEIRRTANKMNIGTLLTGQGGNATVSWPTPGYLQIISKKTDLIKLHHLYTYNGWRYNILPLFFPVSFKNFINKTRKSNVPFLKYSSLKRDFADKINLYQLMKEDEHDPFFLKTKDIVKARLKIIKPGSNIAGFLHSQSAAYFNIETRDPTIDKRIIELCLSFPDDIFVNNGTDRLLIRNTFQNLLPAKVLYNKMRGKQSADISYRILEHLQEVIEILDKMSNSQLCNSFMDIPKLKSIAFSLSKNANNNTNKLTGNVLLRGISAGLFLMKFE